MTELCNGSHPNVVQVLRHGWLPPKPSHYYIDMELCSGNLADYIVNPSFTRMDPSCGSEALCSEIVPILEDIARGLEYLHFHNQVHRDLKPQNSTPSFLVS